MWEIITKILKINYKKPYGTILNASSGSEPSKIGVNLVKLWSTPVLSIYSFRD